MNKNTRKRFCEIYPDKAKLRRSDPIAFDVDYQVWRRIRETAEAENACRINARHLHLSDVNKMCCPRGDGAIEAFDRDVAADMDGDFSGD